LAVKEVPVSPHYECRWVASCTAAAKVDKTGKIRHFLNLYCLKAIEPLLPETQTCGNAKAAMHFASRIVHCLY
jgi:hypothetical protein